MRLKKFDYVEPTSIKEASAILLEEEKAKVLAGGTDLLVNMKHQVENPSLIVNIKRIQGLDFIKHASEDIRIGALTRLKTIFRNPIIAEKIPAFASAAFSVGSYHHQTMGTIGGNLCQQNRCKYFNQSKWWRSARPLCLKAGGEICHVVNKKDKCYSTYCGDIAPALLALNARVILNSNRNSREIPLEQLYSGNGEAPLELQRGEILTEIILPQEAMNGFSTYIKCANRESIDYPIVGVAFCTSRDRKQYGVSFTAVDQKPVKAHHIENFLKGKSLTKETIEEVTGLISKEATPVKTSFYSPSYKRQLMEHILKSTMNDFLRRTQI